MNDPELHGDVRTGLDMGTGYFERMYATTPDPWGFDSEWYETRKYDITMAMLPERRYRRAVEPGCSNGALTLRLAERCDELFAFDFVADVVERARSRLVGHDGVNVVHARFPNFWPAGSGDLVVWSEVAYYLSDDGLDVALRGLERWLEPGGTLIAVHYIGDTNYPQRGEHIAEWLDTAPFLDRRAHCTCELFEAVVWSRRTTS